MTGPAASFAALAADPAAAVWADLAAVKARAPLVVNITNYVVTNNTANALLALGASPAMSHVAEDLPGLLDLAGALVVNLGTLAQDYVDGMRVALDKAAALGIPAVLDPVAAGVNALRTGLAREILATWRPAIVRGNASEILCVAGDAGKPKGVDTSQGVDEALEAARGLAREHGCTVVVSGPVDLVTDGRRVARVAGGSELMPRVTGLGCTATALCGALAAVQPDPFRAALAATAAMDLAGELAAERAAGPGTLQLHLYDELYNLSEATVRARLRAELTEAA
ncbi:MAG: hydroxyethylthiazole kinase [Desulfovibrionaceae bacterium]